MSDNIFTEIEKRILVKDIKESFSKKGFVVNEVTILEFTDDTKIVKILTKNKIIVESVNDKMTWKLDSLNMGEVYGKAIADVAGSYQYEISKDK